MICYVSKCYIVILGKRRGRRQWFALKNCIRYFVLRCAQHPRHPPWPLSVRWESPTASKGVHRRVHRSYSTHTRSRASEMWCRCRQCLIDMMWHHVIWYDVKWYRMYALIWSRGLLNDCTVLKSVSLYHITFIHSFVHSFILSLCWLVDSFNSFLWSI